MNKNLSIMSLDMIWQDFSDHLLAFIKSKVNHSEDAHDILQDVFVKVGTRFSTLKEEEKLQAWLFQITRNTIIDYHRNKQKKNFDSSFLEQDDTTTDSAIIDCVRDLIALLPEKYRLAVELSELEQIPQKELAERLNLSYSGTKSRVQRGREKLKELLIQCCNVQHDRYGNVIEFFPRKSCSNCH